MSKLEEWLFKINKYDRGIAPIYTIKSNSTEIPRFNVHARLNFFHIIGLAEEIEKLQVLLELVYLWEDPRLVWDPEKFGGIEKIYANYKNIWIIENSISETSTIEDFVDDHRKPVKIFSNGKIEFLHKFYTEVICKLELSHFPFDHQKCAIQLMSMSFDYSEVSMTTEIAPIELKYSSSGQWIVNGISTSVNLFNYSIQAFDIATFEVSISRQPLFYLHVIVLPSLIISILSIGGIFWVQDLHSKKLEKLAIGLTSLMSMTVLLDIVSSEIPKTSTLPLLGIYVLICLFNIGVSCVILMILPQNGGKFDEKKKSVSKR